jgi:outer membrane protein OmpA-like peptidoglycan-associated protein
MNRSSAASRASRTGRGIGVTLSAIILLATVGCATKGYVRNQVANSNTETDAKIAGVRTDLDQVRTRADQAYEKATLAERLASGQLEYTEASTHQVQFAFDDATVDGDASTVLDDLASKLTSHPNYVLEIRGFADARGTDRYNYRLGGERASAVERYLNDRHHIPLQRIAVMSMGEEAPLADNDTDDGRAQNRRVMVRLLDAKVEPGQPPVAYEQTSSTTWK